MNESTAIALISQSITQYGRDYILHEVMFIEYKSHIRYNIVTDLPKHFKTVNSIIQFILEQSAKYNLDIPITQDFDDTYVLYDIVFINIENCVIGNLYYERGVE